MSVQLLYTATLDDGNTLMVIEDETGQLATKAKGLPDVLHVTRENLTAERLAKTFPAWRSITGERNFRPVALTHITFRGHLPKTPVKILNQLLST